MTLEENMALQQKNPYDGFRQLQESTGELDVRGEISEEFVWSCPFDYGLRRHVLTSPDDPNAATRWELHRKNYIADLKRKQAEIEANWIEYCLRQIRREEFAESVQVVLENRELVEVIKGHFVKWAHN
jgi:hypothetical protein